MGSAGPYTWGSTELVADVQEWLNDPDGNFGWILLGDESSSRTTKRFNSREHGSADTRPLLSIEYSMLQNGDSEPSPPGLTLVQLSEEIFTVRCALSGCHSGSTPTGDMSLEAGRIAGEIINVASSGRPEFTRIVPGDPDNSYLLKKLRGDSDIVGSQMPLPQAWLGPMLDPFGGALLTDEEIAKIVQWIEELPTPTAIGSSTWGAIKRVMR